MSREVTGTDLAMVPRVPWNPLLDEKYSNLPFGSARTVLVFLAKCDLLSLQLFLELADCWILKFSIFLYFVYLDTPVLWHAVHVWLY